MSERLPKQEQQPSHTKAEVISSLRANSEDFSVLQSYLDKREREVQTSKEALTLNVEVAEIYRDAGFADVAKQAFADAAEQAWQEGEDELYEKLMAELSGFQDRPL